MDKPHTDCVSRSQHRVMQMGSAVMQSPMDWIAMLQNKIRS